jgi:hypothetical protein
MTKTTALAHPLILSLALALAPLATACAVTPAPHAPPQPASPAPEVAPPGPPVAPPPGADAFTIDGPVREEWMPLLKPAAVDPAQAKLLAPPPGLAPLPASCDAYTQRKPSAKVACADPPAALAALDAALARATQSDRDAALADLDGCAGLPAGIARSLRAELAPVECGEAIVEPFLKAPPASTSGIVYAAALGQAIASRLARTAQGAPTLAGPHDRAHVVEFTKGPLRSWFEQQAIAIEVISRAAAELPYYGKGVAAIEAGVAELRLVEAVRKAPIPDEFRADQALQSEYYATLDQGLDPRKDRGRDATLVGLRELALVGVIKDARVRRARALLSRLYGGRRVDALDALVLPPLAKAEPASVEERLAARLPTFYAGLLLDEKAASRPGTLRQLVDNGIPLPQRQALRSIELSPEARALYARARIELGRLYWRAVDFDQAAALASAARTAAPSDDATFLLALALALRNGPDDAADMMRKAPRALPPAHAAALDAVANAATSKSPNAGIAALDAALIHQLAAPEGAGAPYWQDVTRRFDAAAKLLTDPALRAIAEDRARAAEGIVRAITDPPKPAAH